VAEPTAPMRPLTTPSRPWKFAPRGNAKRRRKVFGKQLEYLLVNLRHPSLRAKKLEGPNDLWQARVKPELAVLLQD
jgi:hypothetical protein